MFYALKLAAVFMITVPAALLTILGGFLDRDGKHVYAISRAWGWAVLKSCGISIAVGGLSHIDPKQQYVFMVNHRSNMDIPALIQALRPFQLRWLAKKELLSVPLFGWAMAAAKHIAVDRANRFGALQSLKEAKQRIASGTSLVIFPEGTRSQDGGLLPFKRGGFWLAMQTQTPVVPLTIEGSGAVLPKGDWRIRRGAIHVTVGEPIRVEIYGRGDWVALANQVRAVMARQLQSATGSPTHTADDHSLIRAERQAKQLN